MIPKSQRWDEAVLRIDFKIYPAHRVTLHLIARTLSSLVMAGKRTDDRSDFAVPQTDDAFQLGMAWIFS